MNNSNSPLRIFDLSTLSLYPIDSTMADSKPSAKKTDSKPSAKTDSNASTKTVASTKTDDSADLASVTCLDALDPSIADGFCGLETVLVPNCTKIQVYVDARNKIIEYHYGRYQSAVDHFVSIFIIQLSFQDYWDFLFNAFIFLGPDALEEGLPREVVPWRLLPSEIPG
ncbi:hypothetical protein SEMRO_1452_G273880.1 [Seminavis robusta]|uniref:Uncharacterized protein n=1 Tax=Seminavis robusta TaxID=568900 RepID=A0A9N8HSJ6_9STRA|nr:hypothetical protein SEMRO_1452_G273880.1 [Seminavis robusta]|eukprot:Sro1452_g273880.1 n/a (169) ;mRNA; r:8470-9101